MAYSRFRLWRCLPMFGLLMIGLRPVPAAAAPYAYVANLYTNTVAVIDVASASLVATVPVPTYPCLPGDCGPVRVAVTPDGAHVYVALAGSPGLNSVAVIDTALALTDPTNAVVATIPVGVNPQEVAISPNGQVAYVTNGGGSVSLIATAIAVTDPTHAVFAEIPIVYGVSRGTPHGVAFTSDGKYAMVTDTSNNILFVIDTALALNNRGSGIIQERVLPNYYSIFPGQSVPVFGPYDVIALGYDGLVTTLSGTGFQIGALDPPPLFSEQFIFLNPSFASYGLVLPYNSQRFYVARGGQHAVASLYLAESIGSLPPRDEIDIPVGAEPYGVAATQDGKQVYVTNTNDATVSVIDVKTNAVIGSPIPVGDGGGPFGVVITPGLTAVPLIGSGGLVGVPLNLAVANPGVQSVTWDFFGDGTLVQTTGTATTQFAYSSAGTFTLKATVQLSDGQALSFAVPVFVQSLDQAIDTTTNFVQGLVSLNADEQNSLIVKLDAAAHAVDRGNSIAACGQIGAFLNEGNALVTSGQLTQPQASAALDEGAALQISLSCQ